MKEDICKVCGSDLKWVGSIMDGHVECPNCDAAGVNIDFGSGDESCVTYSYSADDGVVYQTGYTTFTRSDNTVVVSKDPSQTAEDKCNLDDYTEYNDGTVEIGGRLTGKTTALLRAAVESFSDCYVIVSNMAMVHYCTYLLRDQFGCRVVSKYKGSVTTCAGGLITILTVSKAKQRGVLIRSRPLFFDHTVTYEDWQEVHNANL